MTQVIKLSRGAVWGSFAFYVFQSLFILFAVLYATILTGEWPFEPFDRLTLFIGLISFSYGAFGVHHLLKFAFGKRRRTVLHFDGTTISVQIAGRELARFTASDVQAYFPHRNDIELTDGRRIALPSPVPHSGSNEIEMALPWVNAWWPAMDLPVAIQDAERKTGWIRHLPYVSKAIGAFALLLGVILLNRFDGELSIALLAFMIPFSFVFPDLLENLWRRKVVVHFPALNDSELEPEPSDEHDESFAHDPS